MGLCDVMLKYIVFLFNLVFFLTGVGLIGIGAYIQVNMTKYLDFVGSTYLNTSIVLIAVGVVVVVVAFFGCCGACTENSCMMYTFGLLLSLILLASIGCAVAVYLYRDDMRDIVQSGMTAGMSNYGLPDHDGVTETWNVVQFDFKCCGVNGYADWASAPFGEKGSDVPESCCLEPEVGCGSGVAGLTPDAAARTVHVGGCFTGLETEILDNVSTVAGVGVGVGVLIFIGVLIACCLARDMRERSNYV